MTCTVKKQAVLCDNCNSWSHYKCEGLSKQEIKLIEENDSSYTCRSCSDMLTTELQVPRDSGTQNTDLSFDETSVKTDVDVHYVDKDINTDLSNINFDKYSNLIEMEKSLKLKDKELKNRESTIKKKETELNEALLKLSTAQAYIVKLEKI